jgi:ferredoxin-type protein NapF
MQNAGPSRRAFLSGKLIARPTAVFEGGCLARSGVVCHSCGDACPDRAIRFRPTIGAPAHPELDPDLCTGCGCCVAACPAGAIIIGAQREFRP